MRVDEIHQNLEGTKKSPSKKTIASSNTPITIHDVHILDSSGSMDGSKYRAAVEGINQDIKASKITAANTPNLTSTMSIVEFSGRNKIVTHIFAQPIERIEKFSSHNFGGMTALNRTVGETIERFLGVKGPNDKVLIKIFTDGEDNDSQGSKFSSNKTLSDLIEKVQQNNNFTITFVGTKNDVRKVVNEFKIPLSNTLVHDNTAAGISKSYNKTVAARSMFLSSALAGEDVSTGFYTKTLN